MGCDGQGRSLSSSSLSTAAAAEAAEATAAYMAEVAVKRGDLRALQQMLHMKSGVSDFNKRKEIA